MTHNPVSLHTSWSHNEAYVASTRLDEQFDAKAVGRVGIGD